MNQEKPQFEIIDAGNGFIKAWKRGVPFEDKAIEQLKTTARLPFIFMCVAAMPDAHWGMGSTVGSVLPTVKAVVPAAVGVDIGCGMMAVRTNLRREYLGGVDLSQLRSAIEAAIPMGRTNDGGEGDVGSWGVDIPTAVKLVWEKNFEFYYAHLCDKHPGMRSRNTFRQLGTLGTGNHFIELCEDEHSAVWIVLHSGSRGLGNRIGSYFTDLAKESCYRWFVNLEDNNLAYLVQGTSDFNDYLKALALAQKFAWCNRELMMANVLKVLTTFVYNTEIVETVHCHHNYMAEEKHFGKDIFVTRKGAVRAAKGDMGIIPGSMGARSYIVKGLGSIHSFTSCSHGAGRAMGREEAKRRFTLADHEATTAGVECCKTSEVLDETPLAYKDIDAVMAAQSDLVEIVHTLKQFVCCKGLSEGDNRRKKKGNKAHVSV